MERTPYWTAPDGEPVTREQAEKAWIAEAHTILKRIAGTYNQLVDYAGLAKELQAATGIHTSVQPRIWVGHVLHALAAESHSRGEPALSSLVVLETKGMVGKRYDDVLKLEGIEVPIDEMDRERHAAQARLDSYRWAGAEMPPSGGSPTLSPKLAVAESRARNQRRAAAIPPICPNCFMAIPATGVCDNCG